jgi:hypothetical protein
LERERKKRKENRIKRIEKRCVGLKEEVESNNGFGKFERENRISILESTSIGFNTGGNTSGGFKTGEHVSGCQHWIALQWIEIYPFSIGNSYSGRPEDCGDRITMCLTSQQVRQRERAESGKVINPDFFSSF